MDRIDIYLIGGVIFGIFFFFRGFRSFRKKRLIQNIPTSEIRSLALGLIEVIGKAIPIYPLRSPYGKIDSVFYYYRVDQFVRSSRSSGWHKIEEGTSNMPFYIEDKTGKVLVNPTGVEANLESISYFHREGDLKYTERCILPNQQIYVMGTAKKTRDYVQEEEEEVAKKVASLRKDETKIKEIDKDGDGWIDDEEWAGIFQTARKEVREESKEKREKEEEIKKKKGLGELADVAIGKGEEEKVFILSNRSEKELVSHLGGRFFLSVFGGVLLTIICTVLLLLKIGSR